MIGLRSYVMTLLGTKLAGYKTLFLINDIIANETLDKQRQPLLGLAMSGETQRSFTMVTDTILHRCSPKHL